MINITGGLELITILGNLFVRRDSGTPVASFRRKRAGFCCRSSAAGIEATRATIRAPSPLNFRVSRATKR